MNRNKKKNFKASFKRPSFINSNGTIIAHSNGVKVPKNKNGEYMFEQALREFKKIVKESNILDEFKNRQEYIKPSAIKRKQLQRAIRVGKMDNLP